ncbi:MAG: PilT/PilU family type 4a pilus ATPase [Candidatus Sumerlaeaceae bacterium]|nr:PilT/PilU family type 4a pilus ATPase [Candidatus Sumerlaeaceae bacterium]
MERVRKIEDLLQEMVERGASDLFLKAGQRPCYRIDGGIVISDYAEMTMDETHAIALQNMTAEQSEYFARVPEMDLAIVARGVGRFRVNVFRQRGSTGLVFRYISNPSFSFEDLNLPPVVRTLSEKRRGMILVTGTTGSGKSTTLAAMIHHINQMRRCHIVTIEDPIEFLHADDQAIISQREIGFDTKSFGDALKHVLRQSPDVILIGEMRDLETINTAIASAETGHLVLSTLHTMDAVQTIERIINYFPAYLHPQIRMELSLCLEGVICQRLLPMAAGKGRIPAVEIMVGTSSIRKLLHEGKTLELPQYIEGGGHVGMQTFNQALLALYRSKKIKLEDALAYATSADEFRLMAEGIASGVRAKEMGGIYR